MKLVILGRDGVLNQYRNDHVKAPAEWVPVPGALDAVARLHHAGWHVVVATNQAGIGRGLIDMASLNAVHAHMMRQVQAHGGRLDAVFFCPHTPEDQCACRKPRTGLLDEIAQRYGVDLAGVPVAGDTLRDLEAAQQAKAQPHLICTGRAAAIDDTQRRQVTEKVPGAQIHADLTAFVNHLLGADAAADSVAGDLH